MGRIKWTKELAHKEALKYKYLTEFNADSKNAYGAAKRNGWFDEITSHMKRKIAKKYTLAQLKIIALKYKTKSEFQAYDSGAHTSASKQGYLNEICQHMDVLRFRWSYDSCIESAKKYKDIFDWRRCDRKAYDAAGDNGWAKSIYKELNYPAFTMKYSKESIINEAKKYKGRTAFYKGSPHHYSAAIRYGWLDEACSHMVKKFKSHSHDSVKQDALECKTRKEFEVKFGGSVKYAIKNGIYEGICSHMIWGNGRAWTKTECKEEALKHISRIEFKTQCQSAYAYACKRKWLDDICKHMKPLLGFNTIEHVTSLALKYKTKSEFMRAHGGAYMTAHKRGWIDKVCSHMPLHVHDFRNNIVYIWKAKDILFGGKKVYKIGITSEQNGIDRIKRVENSSSMQAELIIMAKVNKKATDIEKELHLLGVNPCWAGFDGATEFRALNETELLKALSIIAINSEIKLKAS